jgi:hypothetical protein
MDQAIREAMEIEAHPNNMSRKDGLCLSRSWKLLIQSLRVRTKPPCQGSKLSQLSLSGQLEPPLGLSLLSHNLLASFISILSHSYTIHLSLFHCGQPPSAIGLLPHLTITHSPLVSPSFTWTTDSYITCYPFMRGLFIALMMEAAHTSKTLVHFNVTTWCYIPEDFLIM